MERTNYDLNIRLTEIWENHFPEVPRVGEVVITFGRRSQTRLGSIKRRAGRVIITITGYFRDRRVPDVVVDETIAHELTHYTHGFESPLPQLYRYPHEGGVVRRELIARGLGDTHRAARRWLHNHWRDFLQVYRLDKAN